MGSSLLVISFFFFFYFRRPVWLKTFTFHKKDETAPPARPTLLILLSLASHRAANAEKWRQQRARERHRHSAACWFWAEGQRPAFIGPWQRAGNVPICDAEEAKHHAEGGTEGSRAGNERGSSRQVKMNRNKFDQRKGPAWETEDSMNMLIQGAQCWRHFDI